MLKLQQLNSFNSGFWNGGGPLGYERWPNGIFNVTEIGKNEIIGPEKLLLGINGSRLDVK